MNNLSKTRLTDFCSAFVEGCCSLSKPHGPRESREWSVSTDMTARDSSIRARNQYRSSSMKSNSGKICRKVASDGCRKLTTRRDRNCRNKQYTLYLAWSSSCPFKVASRRWYSRHASLNMLSNLGAMLSIWTMRRAQGQLIVAVCSAKAILSIFASASIHKDGRP